MKYPTDSGRIKENLYCLGPRFTPAYLLDGAEPVIFDAGLSIAAEIYRSELKRVLGDRSPKYLMLSHMHFDHCGAAGFLKQLYPEMLICASAEGAEIVQKPSAISMIQQLNEIPDINNKLKFIPFKVEKILKDGEVVHLSEGNQVEVLATPGHTRDMLSFYLPQESALVPSEAAGVPANGDYIYSEFLVDCDQYLNSIERLSRYSFDTLLLAHNYYYTQSDAKSYLSRALETAIRFRDRLSGLVEKYKDDIESICNIIKQEEYDTIEDIKQPEIAYLMNLKAKINAVNKWLQKDLN